MKFSEHIKHQREELKLSQSEVAKQLSVTRQTISNWENGKSYPSMEMLIKVSEVYQVSIDSLLSEDLHMQKYLSRKRIIIYFSVLALITLYEVGFLTLLSSSFHFNSFWISLMAIGLFLVTAGILVSLYIFLLYVLNDKVFTEVSKKAAFPVIIISAMFSFFFSKGLPSTLLDKATPYIVIYGLIFFTIIFIEIMYVLINEKRFEEEVEKKICEAELEGKIVDFKKLLSKEESFR